MRRYVAMYCIVALILMLGKSTYQQESSCESNSDPSRCSIQDSECQLQFFRNLRDSVGAVGTPALNIPPVDPYVITNASFIVLGLNVTLVQGETLGIVRTCEGLSYSLDLEKSEQIFEIICTNITITGHYTITSDSKTDKFFGANVNGDGNVNMVAEDWYYKFVTPFEFVRYDDGNIYLNVMYNRSQYISKICKNVDFCMDGITLNDKDISKFVSNFVTDNWELINTPAADPFHRKAVEYFFFVYTQFFTRVPAEEYFCDDLSRFVR